MPKISNVKLPSGVTYDIRATAIPYGELNEESTSTVMTASVPGITELSDGVCCYIRNNVITSAAGWTLSVNGLGPKPVYSSMGDSTRTTTIFNRNYTMMFIYNERRVQGGCWDILYGYSSVSSVGGDVLYLDAEVVNGDEVYY